MGLVWYFLIQFPTRIFKLAFSPFERDVERFSICFTTQCPQKAYWNQAEAGILELY